MWDLKMTMRWLRLDTSSNKVVATIPIGQAPQAVVYVSDAVPEHQAITGALEPLGLAGSAIHFNLKAAGGDSASVSAPSTSVTLFDQGLVQVLEAAVSGLGPKKQYVLALSEAPDGSGHLSLLQALTQTICWQRHSQCHRIHSGGGVVKGAGEPPLSRNPRGIGRRAGKGRSGPASIVFQDDARRTD